MLFSSALIKSVQKAIAAHSGVMEVPRPNGTTFPVFKNPTGGHESEMRSDFRDKFPGAPIGTPKTRQTFDKHGNRYAWMAGHSDHYGVESHLLEKHGIEANQNPQMLTKAVRDVSQEARNPAGAKGGGEWTSTAAKPAAKPVAKPAAKPAGKPITHAFKISGTGPTADKVRDAIKAITRVHGDGTLPTIPLNIAASKRSVSGQFFHSTDGSPLEISIKETAGNPLAHTRMTAVHEIGHFLDHSGLQSKGYASEANNPVVQDVMKTIEGTARVTTLRDMAKKGYVIVTYGNGKRVKEKLPKAYLNYRLEPVELFADAYAHYITFRSGNKAMSEEHKERQSMQGMSHYPDVWDKEDFEQTAQAFDAMFQKMGWRA